MCRVVGTHKVAFQLFEAVGETLHVFGVRAIMVETAAFMQLMQEVGSRGGDYLVR